jgi:hypothetical protein
MTRLIAIIKSRYIERYDNYSVLVESITDWSEVTDEEYALLCNWSNKYDYTVITRLDKQPDFLPKTISAALKEAKKEQEELEKKKQEEQKLKLERELKRKARNEKKERELLEALQEKYKQVSEPFQNH